MNPVPRWRIAAGIAVILGMLLFAVVFTPIYFHNFQFQRFVASLTQTAASQPAGDEALRGQLVAKANSLNLPVTANDVHIQRSSEGVRIDIRYFVTVSLPGYTVNLHFGAGAGSR